MDEVASIAAHRADEAVYDIMTSYDEKEVQEEEAISGALVGALRTKLTGQIGSLIWHATVLRNHKGKAAEEKTYGADILIHVELQTETVNYSKGVLIQAKRKEPGDRLRKNELAELRKQCGRMLAVTPAAFVFDYAKRQMRCGAASRIHNSTNRELFLSCSWTPYRFFLELFRSPIGDERIRSHLVDELPARYGLRLLARGEVEY